MRLQRLILIASVSFVLLIVICAAISAVYFCQIRSESVMTVGNKPVSCRLNRVVCARRDADLAAVLFLSATYRGSYGNDQAEILWCTYTVHSNTFTKTDCSLSDFDGASIQLSGSDLYMTWSYKSPNSVWLYPSRGSNITVSITRYESIFEFEQSFELAPQ